MTEGSDKIDCEGFEIGERHDLQRSTMCRLQADLRCAAGLESLLPPRRAEAPAVPRLEPQEAELRSRRRQVIASGAGELEELRRHHGTDGMRAGIRGVGLAATASEPASFRRMAAVGEGFAEHIDLPVLTVAAAVHGGTKGT